jgi:hypothetical protein
MLRSCILQVVFRIGIGVNGIVGLVIAVDLVRESFSTARGLMLKGKHFVNWLSGTAEGNAIATTFFPPWARAAII